MNVVPHREFGQVKVCRDFLVCLTFGDESDQLLLTQGEFGPRNQAWPWRFLGPLRDEPE